MIKYYLKKIKQTYPVVLRFLLSRKATEDRSQLVYLIPALLT